MKLDESFDITHLFHDPNVNPTMVRVISSDPCLRLSTLLFDRGSPVFFTHFYDSCDSVILLLRQSDLLR